MTASCFPCNLMRTALSLLLVTPVLCVWGYSTNAVFPGSAVSTGTGVAWTSPTNALSQNAQTADSDLFPGDQTAWLLLTNFNFASMSSAAVLTGINATVRRRGQDSVTAINDVDVQLYTTSQQGTDKSSSLAWTQTTLTDVSFGGPTDLWGSTLTAAVVKTTSFGIRLKAIRSAADSNPKKFASIDSASITLHYDCPAGTFGSACTVCAAGAYSTVNTASCTACPATTTTVGNAAADHDSLADCVCAAGNFGPPAGPCTNCASSEYQDLANQPVCKSCPSNSRVVNLPGTALSSCVCIPGAFGSAGAACTLCAAGTAQPNAGSASCPVCASGTYQINLGQTSCSSCTPNSQTQGTLSSNHDQAEDCQCSAGYAGSAGGPCLDCVAGTFSSLNSPSCSTCAAGTFSLDRASTCTVCPANQFQSSPGQGSCIACQLNSVTTGTGAANRDSQLDCRCQVGYEGTTTCTACSAGTIAPNLGTASCAVCAANTYQTATTQTSCVSCPTNTSTQGSTGADRDQVSDCRCLIGHAGPVGSACALCSDNTYQDVVGQSSCKTCPANTSVTGSAADSHDAITDCLCDVGHFGAPGAACSLCPEDNFQPLVGQTSCLACPQNSKATGDTALSHNEITDCLCVDGYVGVAGGPCSACPIGTFSTGLDKQMCTVCGVGEYQLFEASTSCFACLQGLTTAGGLPENHDSPTDCVCPSGSAGPPGGPCTSCGLGQFSSAGDLTCTDCPPGTFSNSANSSSCIVCGANEFQAESNSTSCQPCPTETSTEGTEPSGHDSPDDCQVAAAESAADNTIVIAAAAGGGAALLIVVAVIVFFVVKRKNNDASSKSYSAPSAELELDVPSPGPRDYARAGSLIPASAPYGNTAAFANVAVRGDYGPVPTPPKGSSHDTSPASDYGNMPTPKQASSPQEAYGNMPNPNKPPTANTYNSMPNPDQPGAYGTMKGANPYGSFVN